MNCVYTEMILFVEKNFNDASFMSLLMTMNQLDIPIPKSISQNDNGRGIICYLMQWRTIDNENIILRIFPNSTILGKSHVTVHCGGIHIYESTLEDIYSYKEVFYDKFKNEISVRLKIEFNSQHAAMGLL